MSDVLIRPCSIKAANAFVSLFHRHHPASPNHLFACAAALPEDPEQILGVAIVGRPTARLRDDGFTAEVVRVAVHTRARHRHPSSALYGAARAACKALGYQLVLSYTLPEESGASLRGAGFLFDGISGGGSHSRPSRERVDRAPTCPKLRWTIRFGASR